MANPNPLVKPVAAFQTSDGKTHPSKLVALSEEQKIAVRGLIHSKYEEKFGFPLKNGNLATSEMIAVVLHSAKEIAECVAKFDRAIKKEQSKGGNAE